MPVVPLPIVVYDSIKVHLHDYSDADSTDWEVLEAAFRIEADPQTRARQGFDMWKVKEEEDLVNKERVVVSEGTYILFNSELFVNSICRVCDCRGGSKKPTSSASTVHSRALGGNVSRTTRSD